MLREQTIAACLAGTIDPEALEHEARAAIERVDAVHTNIRVQDMSRDFVITAPMLVRLCDAALAGQLSPESLRAIAFTCIASDHFEWNDDIVAEVLHDWSAPEVNYPLDASHLARFRKWLLGEEPYPEKPPAAADEGKIIAVMEKIPG